jgi:hypothetical protein
MYSRRELEDVVTAEGTLMVYAGVPTTPTISGADISRRRWGVREARSEYGVAAVSTGNSVA